MIISRTPFRISFFGGGTDYPDWYLKHGGAVLGTAIDKYCHLTCRYLPPFLEYKYRVVYSIIENCHDIKEIKHPSVRAVLNHLKVNRGVEIHTDNDLPARSGMGSSSAFTVGLLNVIHALKGQMLSRHDLTREAIDIEQNHIRECVGSQDQTFAAYGGLNHVVFSPNGEISVRPITIARERLADLNDHLMLFYTGIRRTAANVAESYVTKIEDNRRQLRVLKDLVDEGVSILGNGRSLTAFGELLDEAWAFKRSLSKKVSNPEVDQLFDTAKRAGAIGGKITGAGGGGFALLFVPPEKQAKVKDALKKLIYVPFHFEFDGSQIIFYDVETDYRLEAMERETKGCTQFRELDPEEAKAEWT